jgi:hypothetical protein
VVPYLTFSRFNEFVRRSPVAPKAFGAKAFAHSPQSDALSTQKRERTNFLRALRKLEQVVGVKPANTKAAYRFFFSDHISAENIFGRTFFNQTRARSLTENQPILVLHDAMELSYKFQARGHQAKNWIMSVRKSTRVVPGAGDCGERSRPAYSSCRTERGAPFRQGAEERRRSHVGESRPNFVLKKGPFPLRLNLKYGAQMFDETKMACLLGQLMSILVLVRVAKDALRSPRLLGEGCYCG